MSAGTEVRRSARSGAVGLAGAVVNGLFGFVLTLVIVRSFGTAGSGALFAAIGLLTVAAAVCCLGADTALVWALPRRGLGPRGDAARLLPVALLPPVLLAIAAATGGWLAADTLAAILLDRADPAGRDLFRLVAVGLPGLVLATLLLAAVRGTRPVTAYVAVQSLLVPIGRPLLIGAAVLAGGGVVAGFTGWLLPVALAALAAAILVAGPLGIGAGAPLRAHRADWSALWGFALPRAASVAVDAGSVWVGVLLCSALAGQSEAGVLAGVGRYALAGLLVMNGLRIAVAPQLSRLLGADRRAEAAAVYRRTAGWIVLLSWPAYLVLAVFAPGFLQLFGPGFAGGAAALTVLAVAMLVNVGVGLVQTVLLMSGNSRTHLYATAAGLVLNVAVCLVAIPRLGALGAALGWAAGIVVENLIAAAAARRVLGEPLFDAGSARLATAAAAGTGLACLAGMTVAGRGLGGLGLTLGLLAAGGLALLADRRVRAAVRQARALLRPGAPPKEGSKP